MDLNYSNHNDTETHDYIRDGINAYLIKNPSSLTKIAQEIGINRVTLSTWLMKKKQVRYSTLVKMVNWLKGQQ